MKTVDYEAQAQAFLHRFGLTFRAAEGPAQCPPWAGDGPDKGAHCSCGTVHGNHYRVTIGRKAHRDATVTSHLGRDGAGHEARFCGHADHPQKLTFSFWDSFNAMQKGESLRPYDVLASIRDDITCPDTFEDFCGEYGYDTDSRKALQIFRRVDRFAQRLRAFFTADEQEALAEIW